MMYWLRSPNVGPTTDPPLINRMIVAVKIPNPNQRPTARPNAPCSRRANVWISTLSGLRVFGTDEGIGLNLNVTHVRDTLNRSSIAIEVSRLWEEDKLPPFKYQTHPVQAGISLHYAD